MIIAVDYDDTIIDNTGRKYADVSTTPTFMPGVRAALEAMVREGHTLILFSARANLALRKNWRLNPLWRTGAVPVDIERLERSYQINEQRFSHMISVINTHFAGIFAAIDDGTVGKVSADLFIDDKALAFGRISWQEIAVRYGKAAGADS